MPLFLEITFWCRLFLLLKDLIEVSGVCLLFLLLSVEMGKVTAYRRVWATRGCSVSSVCIFPVFGSLCQQTLMTSLSKTPLNEVGITTLVIQVELGTENK